MATDRTGTTRPGQAVRLELTLQPEAAERFRRLAKAENRTLAGQLRHLVLRALASTPAGGPQ